MLNRKLLQDRTTLFCFSPAVMIVTFAVELFLAAVVLIRDHVSRFGQIAAGVLILLATFQFAEYRICTTTPISTVPRHVLCIWSDGNKTDTRPE